VPIGGGSAQLKEALRERLVGTYIPKGWKFIKYPVPMLESNPAGYGAAWDGGSIEAPKVVRGDKDTATDLPTYYMFYHAYGTLNGKTGTRIGVATSNSPLGPWTKYAGNPILDVGPPGSFDDLIVALGDVMYVKEEDKWVMWYCGRSGERVSIGLATAPAPTGPWTKYEGNPIITPPEGKRGGWIEGVVRIGDTYYTLYPDDYDYGDLILYTAPAPEGPWKSRGYALIADKYGWERLGVTPGGMMYRDGVFHLWYSSEIKWVVLHRQGAVGHAWSVDGLHWVKSSLNPVIWPSYIDDHDRDFVEHPYPFVENGILYLYTLAYNYKVSAYQNKLIVYLGYRPGEPWKIPATILEKSSLAAGSTTVLGDCQLLRLEGVSSLALTAECTYDAAATNGVRVHVRTSPDGSNWDSQDLTSFDVDLEAGATARKTVYIQPDARFMKVLVENLDGAHTVSDVKVTAIMGAGL